MEHETEAKEAVASSALFGADVIPCRENENGEWVPITAVNELYECRACGHDYPCRIMVTRESTSVPHVESQSRIPHERRCVCGEPKVADWKRVK